MTEPPQGRDGSPSVAALALQVNSLRGQTEALAAKVEAVISTQQEHAAVLDDIAELRQQVEQILTVLTEENEVSPAEWFWLRMSDQVREEKLGELFDWVETVLHTQYPDYVADQIKPCWPNHPRSEMGTRLALPAMVPHLPSQTITSARCSRLARPVGTRRIPPPERRHEPVRRRLPAAAYIAHADLK